MPVIFQDSFETAAPEIGAAARNVINHADTVNGTVTGTNGDYFYRTNMAQDTTVGANENFNTGLDGSWFFRGEDVRNSTGAQANDLGIIEWSGIDITGQTGLSFAGLFAARDFTTLQVEADDFLEVRYTIDAGAEVVGIRFLGTGVVNGDGDNWQQDKNLDGVLDAADAIGGAVFLSEDFAEFTFDIAGTGNTLELVFEDRDYNTAGARNANGEEIAIDNFRLLTPAADVDGTPGDDFLTGTSEGENLNGSDGKDIIHGLGGDDVLNGGEGDDYLIGGEGADELNGGNGTDVALYFHAASSVTIDLSDTANNAGDAAGDVYNSIETFYGSFRADTLIGSAAGDRLHGHNGADDIFGNDGADMLFGGGGADDIDGGAANDRIYGGSGNDGILGGNGNDRIYGENGEDTIEGGTGNDVMSGGLNIDTFVFNANDGRDSITDWQDGVDVIQFLSGADDFSDIKVVSSRAGASTIISYDGGKIVLRGYSDSASITADDFLFGATPPPMANGLSDKGLADLLLASAPVADPDGSAHDTSGAGFFDAYDVG